LDSTPRSRPYHQMTVHLRWGRRQQSHSTSRLKQKSQPAQKLCVQLYRHSDLILPHTRLVHRLALLHQCYSARHTSRKVRPYFVSIPTLFTVIPRTKYTPLQYFRLCLRVTPVSCFLSIGLARGCRTHKSQILHRPAGEHLARPVRRDALDDRLICTVLSHEFTYSGASQQ
jgi:hypothetical protein